MIKDYKDKKNVLLSEFAAGEAFKDCDGDRYTVIKQEKEYTYVLRESSLIQPIEFGDDNNWNNSKLRVLLNGDFLKVIEKRFGSENIIEHEIDLSFYGKTYDKIGLMTDINYETYKQIIIPESDWWLLTPAKSSYFDVNVVLGNKIVVDYYCGSKHCVRPFFILKSSVIVSNIY